MVNGMLRRAVLGGLAAGWAGCAPIEPQAPTPPSRGQPGAALLSPWATLTGGWLAPAAPIGTVPAPLPTLPPAIGLPQVPGLPPAAQPLQRINFQLPFGVAARGDVVVIADAGWRQLFRLERARDQLVSLGPWANALAADHATGLQITADGSVWLADPGAGRVVQLDALGRVRRQLRDERYGARPVAVFASSTPGDVYVGESSDARILVFEPFGRLIRRFGEGKLQSLAAMAIGPLGLYVVDRLAQQVVVFDLDGRVRFAFGEGNLVQPRAIAVDREGRVFIGDDADSAIKVFVDGERIAQAGGRAAGPLRFGRIDALALDDNQLFVADATSARVQVLLVSPESLRKPGG
jgi:sugar lactone lactonase YvrE